MCTRPFLFLALAIALAPVAVRPAAAGLDDPDTALVVILVDGLVDGCIDARFDGQDLMPRTAAFAGRARRCTDVLTPDTNPRLARRALSDAIAEFGAEEVRTVRSAASDTLLAALDTLAMRRGRQALVLDVPWLEPPVHADEDALRRLDPQPWSSMTGAMEIEGQTGRRLVRARRLASLSGRGSGRGQESLILDVQWVIRAAHATVDARIAELLARAVDGPGLAGRAVVVLTACSATGTGERGLIGPFVGVELDVARVPVLVWSAGLAPGTDIAPRQWIGFDQDWLERAGPADRFTWSWAERSGRQGPVCELRWTTEGFTLIDASAPRRPPRLHDRQLDPGEWFDRAVAEPALADSLRRAMRARLYGEAPVLVFAAGESPVTLRLVSRANLEGPEGRLPSAISLKPGETLRVRMPDGADTIEFGRALSLVIGGERRELEALVVHSPAWRAALGRPVPGDGLRLWIE